MSFFGVSNVMKLFSIIIPHYNSWNELQELLNSIPEKNDLEIIVVDDHSDNAFQKIEKFKKKYTHVEFYFNDIQKKNAGVARNKGIEVAKGSWLIFADADDKFSPDFFKTIYHYQDSKEDIIFFKPLSFSEIKNFESKRHLRFSQYLLEYFHSPSLKNELKLKFFFVVPWSKMIRSTIVKANKIYFEEVIVSNDILFSAKIAVEAKSIKASNETIYLVRQAPGSLTNLIDEEKFKIRFEEWLKYVVFIKENTSKLEFKELNISGTPKLLEIVKYKLSLKTGFYVLVKLFKNNIPLLDMRLLNPFFIFKASSKYMEIWKSDKKTINH